MALVERSELDRIEIVMPHKHVQVRRATWVEDNSTTPPTQVGGKAYTRYVVSPGDDYSEREEEVRNICSETHTESVISQYQQFLLDSENTTPEA